MNIGVIFIGQKPYTIIVSADGKRIGECIEYATSLCGSDGVRCIGIVENVPEYLVPGDYVLGIL